MHPIDWASLATCISVAVLFGLLIYHAVAGCYHLRYYVLRRDDPASWKCQPKRFLPRGFQRNAAIVGTLNLTLGGVLTGIFLYAIKSGLDIPLYYEVREYGWPYTIGSTIGLFVLVDAMAYYIHRALHFRFLFRHVHRYHHRFVATTPYVAAALHPVELLSLQFSSFLPLFFVPLHVVSVVVVLVYILVFNIIDHSGVALSSRIPWQAGSAYHDDHHAHFHVNFGQHLMIWDRMHGTLRRKNQRYGKHVFGGRGVHESDPSRAPGEFFAY